MYCINKQIKSKQYNCVDSKKQPQSSRLKYSSTIHFNIILTMTYGSTTWSTYYAEIFQPKSCMYFLIIPYVLLQSKKDWFSSLGKWTEDYNLPVYKKGICYNETVLNRSFGCHKAQPSGK
jgi:hypothetical protein